MTPSQNFSRDDSREANSRVRQNSTLPADMLKKREWSSLFICNPAQLPISFKLDGKTITGIPTDWKPASRKRRIDANIIETICEGTDATTGLHLRVECTEYLDYPVVEWIAWFTNQGSQPTPILRDILAMDCTFTGASPILYHCNGDFGSADGFTPTETPLREGDTLAFAPKGGHPCDHAFPYYRIMFKDFGFTLAIGWPAQWSASFTGIADGLQVKAGQEKTHLRLMPGEKIRTPRITIMSWTGDAARAANLWRRWYRDHILPRTNGQPLKPLLACSGTDEGQEFTMATEANQVRYIEKFNDRGICPDVWWIDAGWYPCYDKNHKRTYFVWGTWKPDPERFPNGLKPVSDFASRHGADLLLWFVPEYVRAGTQIHQEHPEWLWKFKEPEGWVKNNGEGYLLNLGNPQARQWLTDHVCKLIQDNGIKIYRQDGGGDILGCWRTNEGEDRQGMNENLHVQGYLQYWDDLLARNPGLWIDSCASGGRRNDLETMRRSVPLHYTDYGYGNHPVKLAFQHTMFEWLPYFKEFTLSWDLHGNSRYDHQVDSYSYHCGMAPMLWPSIDINRDDYDYDLMKRMLVIWRRAADMILNGDYYPLTPLHRTPEKWVARQFDCPEEGRGFIQGIRLPVAAEEILVVHPEALQQNLLYVFENPETGETRELTGKKVNEDGFTLTLPKREGAIWFYRVK
jgi:alpha-galactosidase